MDSCVKLQQTTGELLADPSSYRRLVGKLLYLIVSRPDIMFVMHKLSQYVANLRQSHMVVVHTLLHYL